MTPKRLKTWITIERDGVELDVTVTGQYPPGRPERMIMGWVDDAGKPVGLTTKEAEIAEEALWDAYALTLN